MVDKGFSLKVQRNQIKNVQDTKKKKKKKKKTNRERETEREREREREKLMAPILYLVTKVSVTHRCI